MALKIGTATPALMLDELTKHLKGGVLKIFGSPRPASADAVETGTVLATITKDGASFTAETKATAVIVLSGGSGSIDTLKAGGSLPLIGSAVAFDTSLAITTDNLAAAINAYKSVPKFTAVSNGVNTVTISAPTGLGASANGLTIAITLTTMTATVNGGSSAAFGGTGSTAGVTAVNGLNFNAAVGKYVEKLTGEVWADLTADASGTGVWYRYYPPGAVTGASTSLLRVDGSVGVTGSGADLTMASTTITAGEPVYINSFKWTLPSGE